MTQAGLNLLSFQTEGEKDQQWIEVEEEEKELFCDVCFKEGLPYKVASYHFQGAPQCSSLTPREMKYWQDQPEQARETQDEVVKIMVDNKMKLEKMRRKKQVATARR